MIVFVMIDGLRPDALGRIKAPNLSGLRANGSWTPRAQSVMPSITLPCHTSIFHSVRPEQHGVTDNKWTPVSNLVPGLVDVAHQAGLKTAFFINWEPLRDLSRPGSLTYSYFLSNDVTTDGDEINAVEIARTLGQHKFDFAFVYFGNVDNIGHAYGWMSKEYLAQAERSDKALGTVLGALPPDSTVLLHADHGGHDTVHGTESPEDMNIPWIVSGPGIRRGYEIQGPVSLLDTAPTLARLLGIAPPSEWQGHSVDEIFV
jgi:predicted AlkP superfamily pyrophosphatase or phosphodiesterase